MAAISLFPIVGINNVVADEALQQGGDSPKLYLKDAINVDITATGKIKLRKGAELLTSLAFKNLWQSPLHGDVFAVLEGQLVKLKPESWSFEVLLKLGHQKNDLRYEVINQSIYIADDYGIWIYNGLEIQPLTIGTPPTANLTSIQRDGALKSGTYSVAISWLRGQLESGLSSIASISIEPNQASNNLEEAFASLQLNLPYCLDSSITQVRIYISERNGSELLHEADYPISQNQITLKSIEKLGMSARFIGLSAMPTGKMMKYWQGRLITADKNILRFSEPLAYHLHDEKFGFVLMPQRITFLIPVSGGIWVGQITHVIFLTGTKPQDMSLQVKSTLAPVPNSAIELDMNDIGAELSQSGNSTALWLAENGYVIGTSSGQVIELHAGVITGIQSKFGRSVRLGRRVTTIVS